jgi:hypothetical protein
MDRELARSSGNHHLGTVAALDQFGYVRKEWKSLSSRLVYGIAWTW